MFVISDELLHDFFLSWEMSEIMYIAVEYVEMIVFWKSGRNARTKLQESTLRFRDQSNSDHKVMFKVISRAQETDKVQPYWKLQQKLKLIPFM